MRETAIKSNKEKVVAHAAANGGSCRPGFDKEPVGKALFKLQRRHQQ
jgi:hypothetical protein